MMDRRIKKVISWTWLPILIGSPVICALLGFHIVAWTLITIDFLVILAWMGHGIVG